MANDHKLYDIWLEPDPDPNPTDKNYFPWKVQMVNYVANIRSEAAAKQFVEVVTAERNRLGLKQTKASQ